MSSKLMDRVSLLGSEDFLGLLTFLNQLSPETKSRFGPHGFNLEAIQHFYQDSRNLGYCFKDSNQSIVGYAILRHGFLEHDRFRLEGYGLMLDSKLNGTFAPAVADSWQGKGVGQQLFNTIKIQSKELGITRIFLWGGVQLSNSRAIHYYQKQGFKSLGQFEYYGWNLDMCYDLPFSIPPS